MHFSDKDINRIVTDIWTTMLGLEIEFVPGGVAAPPAGCSKIGYIRIDGAWEGVVALSCPDTVICRAAASMFAMAEDQVSAEEMRDTLGELTNMTAGNIHTLLPSGSSMSLPSVAEGVHRHAIPGGRIVLQLGFLCEGEPLLATIMDRERRKYGRNVFESRQREHLSLYVAGRPVGIRKAHDHSPGGIGLLVDGCVHSGHEATLRYRSVVSDIEMCGSIAWSASAGPAAGCRIGICLQSEGDISESDIFPAASAQSAPLVS